MAKTFVALTGVVGAVKLAWEDCGDADTHGIVTDLAPLDVDLGNTKLTGKGFLDEDTNSGTYSFSAKLGAVTILEGNGDLCSESTIEFPLNAGSLVFHGVECPTASGEISLDLDLNVLSSIASNDLINIKLNAVSDVGHKLLCMDITTDDGKFAEFKDQYGRVYNGEEDDYRRQVFYKNLAFINAENAKDHSHVLGIGPFADRTAEEFKALLGSKPEQELPALERHSYEGEVLADRLDWTEQGVVTGVKDQGQCGSCWAFSTTGALESGLKLHSDQLVELSEQQLVDCAGFPNMGCNGGNMGFALRFAKDHDFCTESSYRYEAKGSSCRSSSCTVGMSSGTVTGVKSVAPLIGTAKDQDLKSALAVQPLSIAIEADQDIFQHYKSGTITGNCGTNTDHGVLLVGYGTDSAGNDYWKVKNSWGASWGDNGYVKMVQGKNQCGINSGPNYPLFGSSMTV